MNGITVITGASSGIGESYAQALHERGHKLLLIARREERLSELCATFNKKRADSAEYIKADLSQLSEIYSLKKEISERNVSLLINNAGRGSFGEFETIPCVEEAEMAILNCVAPLVLSHAVIPQMKARRSGAIIYLSSVAGFQPLPFMSTYAATKAFDLFHGLGLYYELRPYGIKVLSVCPGPTQTEFRGVARVPGRMSGGGRDDVTAVVSESLETLAAGKPYCVTCWRPKLMVWLMGLLPIGLRISLIGKELKATLAATK